MLLYIKIAMFAMRKNWSELKLSSLIPDYDFYYMPFWVILPDKLTSHIKPTISPFCLFKRPIDYKTRSDFIFIVS